MIRFLSNEDMKFAIPFFLKQKEPNCPLCDAGHVSTPKRFFRAVKIRKPYKTIIKKTRTIKRMGR